MHEILRPTQEEAERAIDQLELGPLLAACRRANRWSEQDAETAETWYRQHLKLCFRYPDQPIAALSKKADLLWHHHIVDTFLYRDDCNRIFGTFLNHVPLYERPTPDDSRAFKTTIELYRREFGEPPPDIEETSLFSPAPPPGPPPPIP